MPTKSSASDVDVKHCSRSRGAQRAVFCWMTSTTQYTSRPPRPGSIFIPSVRHRSAQ
ncbi:unnamed protein product [Amoebophrya sp. A25]|nr:unnamed protein product [Amoebophrya sp. A25]|eukprot:GSA25T00002175001.1